MLRLLQVLIDDCARCATVPLQSLESVRIFDYHFLMISMP